MDFNDTYILTKLDAQYRIWRIVVITYYGEQNGYTRLTLIQRDLSRLEIQLLSKLDAPRSKALFSE